jgi:hypothetical protein
MSWTNPDPKAKELVDRLEPIHTAIRQIVQAEIDGFDEAAVTKTVKGVVKDAVEAVALEALGIRKEWDRWRIDHCNSRRNLLSDIVKEHAYPAAKKWLERALDNILSEEMPLKYKAALDREFQDYFWQSVFRRCQDKITEKAHLCADEYCRRLFDEAGIK